MTRSATPSSTPRKPAKRTTPRKPTKRATTPRKPRTTTKPTQTATKQTLPPIPSSTTRDAIRKLLKEIDARLSKLDDADTESEALDMPSHLHLTMAMVRQLVTDGALGVWVVEASDGRAEMYWLSKSNPDTNYMLDADEGPSGVFFGTDLAETRNAGDYLLVGDELRTHLTEYNRRLLDPRLRHQEAAWHEVAIDARPVTSTHRPPPATAERLRRQEAIWRELDEAKPVSSTRHDVQDDGDTGWCTVL